MIHDQFNKQLETGSFVTLSEIPKDIAFNINKEKLNFFQKILNKPLLISDINEYTDSYIELEYTEDNKNFKWFWVNSHDVNLITS